MARVYLEQPFFVPDQTLKIVREDGSYDLADNYRLDVELTAADGKEWPPLDLTIPPERNSQGARRWVLLACLVDLFKRSRMSVDLYMHHNPEKGVMSSITVNVADPNTGATNGTDANGVPTPDTLVNGTSNSSVNGFVRDGSEEPEGDTTPNRALRTRGNRVYNLKLLSDKAQGKSKGGRRRKRDDGQITYVLPNDQFSLDSYRCVACGQFRVTHNYDWFPPSEEFHFTRSSRPLSLEEATDPALEPQKSLKPLPAGAAIKRPALPKPPVKKPPKKIFVPQTKQPLYDSVSRARLEPGTELIPPQSDDRWWIQKHRDIISDFVDIELPEREYILAWDKFVLPKRLSSEIFVPRVLLEFLGAKAVWIVSSEQREEEFFKHLAYLQLRDVVDQPTLDEINLILQDARAARANKEGSAEDQEEDEPEEVWKREQPTCLICGSPPVGAICTLVCSNAACGHHFHLTCLQDGIRRRPTEENWLCNSCVDEIPPAEPQDAPANVPQDAA
ncbi:unnamed protein product [Parascedosporium putredinis]|uniref:PHD-type domain-containing protein n=1 Tax=Parascedosporium putredinis TaxID=1442378 RepID=A0A9P1GXA9_9PEZI|nr:unnamed protein product [Parascedosporium putredinis]CAI7988854.1 unnamed protein product [Parascedosporium putredinis]